MEVIKTAIDGVFILEPRIFNDAREEGISLKASQDVNLKKKYAGLHLYRIMRVSPLTVYYAACISRNLLSHKANWCV